MSWQYEEIGDYVEVSAKPSPYKVIVSEEVLEFEVYQGSIVVLLCLMLC